jgi:hypothetical protein
MVTAMKSTTFRRVFLCAVACAVAIVGSAQTGASARKSFDPYAPYEFLIGQWDVAPETGGPPVARTTFQWGPGNSYIWYGTSFLVDGAERPHFEGLLVWNGVRKNLDMLLSVDLEGGRVQERGVVSVKPDGTVVREIMATYSEGTGPMGRPPAGPAGATARFRQIFRPAGSGRILTKVLRESGKSWVATFPGSDRLVMTRRS